MEEQNLSYLSKEPECLKHVMSGKLLTSHCLYLCVYALPPALKGHNIGT